MAALDSIGSAYVTRILLGTHKIRNIQISHLENLQLACSEK